MLLARLQSKLGVRGIALEWFRSYLCNRSQRVAVNGVFSRPFLVNSGVPQGSCLGTLLFNIYVSSLFDTIEKHQPTVHSYADDFQLYLSFRPSCGTGVSEECVAVAMQNCLSDIKSWARLNSLMLNDGKTEFIVIGTRQQLAKTYLSSLHAGEAQIPTSSTVRNLGAWFDATFSIASHVTKTCGASFYHLQNIRRVRKYLSPDAAETLVHAFITSRVDYCNSLMYGLPAYQIGKVQRVQNAAARLVACESKYCQMTPLLKRLHWLPVRSRIKFKLLLITFKAIHGIAPDYICIKDLIVVRTPSKYALRSNDSLFLCHPSFKSYKTLGDRSFAMAAPNL